MSMAFEVDSAAPSAQPGAATTEFCDVATLAEAAVAGDQRAWQELVGRYTPLVLRVTSRFRLSHADAEDVGQFVWLRLFQHLGRLRDARALPGWIATTARNESLRTTVAAKRTTAVDPISYFWADRKDDAVGPEDVLLSDERCRTAQLALADLKPEQRELLLLLHSDDDLGYAEISKRMHLPVGSIGPTRSRCLGKLRATTAIRNLRAAS